MKVRVLLDIWGRFKKGDVTNIENKSTALACIKAGAVESLDAKVGKAKVEPKEDK